MVSKLKIQASVYIRDDLYAIVQKAAHLRGISVSSYLGMVGLEQARKEIREFRREKENENKEIC